MKRPYYQIKRLSNITLIFCLSLSVCFMAGCKKNDSASPNSNADMAVEGDVEDTYMKAPSIEPDANGLISLKQCPTEDKHLKVEMSENCDTAKILYDGEVIQTITDGDQLVTDVDDKCPVHYMDANFDGFVDIFLGQGESRTYSCLLVWDAEQKQFERIGELGSPVLQNFMLYPSSKSVIEGGSNSAFDSSFTMSVWEENRLVKQEELCIVFDPAQYEELNVGNKFTVRDNEGGEVRSVGSPSDLTGVWKNVAEIFK